MNNIIIEMDNKFKLIEKYEQISELITANLKKGVRTNTAMSREEYEREISHGSLMAGETPQGLIILRNRPSHIKLNYYINDTDSLLDMAETVEAISAAGWNIHGGCSNNNGLSRVRLSRPAGAPDENAENAVEISPEKVERREEENSRFTFYVKKSTAEDAAAIRPLLHSSFSPITGCLPEGDELRLDAAAGNILMLFADNASRLPAARPCGLLHYAAAKKSAEIKHLAIAPQMRGKGLSAVLINAFLKECSGMKTTVWTGSGNAPALNAYKDCGFTEDGRRSSVMIYTE